MHSSQQKRSRQAPADEQLQDILFAGPTTVQAPNIKQRQDKVQTHHNVEQIAIRWLLHICAARLTKPAGAAATAAAQSRLGPIQSLTDSR
jgi:hypothetical protein